MAKGYSIHLGIKDYCVQGSLCRFTDKLLGAYAAANELCAIATAAGFIDAAGTAPTVQKNENASLPNLTAALQAVNTKLASGDYLVVTFAGFGIGHNASSASAATGAGNCMTES